MRPSRDQSNRTTTLLAWEAASERLREALNPPEGYPVAGAAEIDAAFAAATYRLQLLRKEWAQHGGSLDILVFDSDAEAGALTEEIVGLEGLYVENVQTLGAALAALTRHAFQVVLLDVQLNESATRREVESLRASAPNIIVVAFCASVPADQSLFDHCLLKPVDFDVLRRILRP